jgi:hypothetical protein
MLLKSRTPNHQLFPVEAATTVQYTKKHHQLFQIFQQSAFCVPQINLHLGYHPAMGLVTSSLHSWG